MPLLWRFRCFVTAGGVDAIRSHVEAQTKELQGRFLSRMRILAQLPQGEWHDTYYKRLVGPWDGLAEVRFKANGVQQRPLGFHSGDREFTLLYWATEKGDKFVPKSACDIALERKSNVVGNREAHSNAFWLSLE